MVTNSQLGTVLVSAVRLGLMALGTLAVTAGGEHEASAAWGTAGFAMPVVDAFVRSGGYVVWQQACLVSSGRATPGQMSVGEAVERAGQASAPAG